MAWLSDSIDPPALLLHVPGSVGLLLVFVKPTEIL
jgi:hypothetical protein